MNVRLAALAVSIGVVTALPAGWAQAVSPGDRDHDHVSDDLQARLTRAASGDELDVIVTGIGVRSARGHVGTMRHVRALPIVDGFSARLTAGQVRALARTPGVRRVETDGVVHALDDGTDRDFGAALARSDTPGLDGSGVGLCVVDTGVDPTHEQVAPRTVTFKDFVNGRTTAYDDHGHGTHVTGIAAGDGTGGSSAATFRGVAPAATLYAAKVLDSSGSGSDSQVIAGIQWCAAQPGVDVITMSLGDTAGGDGTDASSVAVDNAVAAGVVVVVAAGNSGDAPRTINSPGTARGAITVGAVSDWSSPAGTARHDDGTWLAAFSSRGPTTDGRTKPDVAGPGVTVTSAQAGSPTGYVTMSGTSMATPYVAGAALLGLEAVPSATPAQVRAALTGSARDVGPAGTDNEWGAGLVDVRAFVDTLTGATVRRTPMPAQSRVSGTVPTNGSTSVPVVVPPEGVGVPIGVTMTIAGSLACDPFFGCLFAEWSPDLDLELRSPTGTVLQSSRCTLSGIFCGVGRQETIGFTPTVAGTYSLRAYADPGSPNNGKGGSFAMDISQGPVGGAVTPPPPPVNQAPVANAGPDRTYKRNKRTNLASFTLDGSASTDPEGGALGYSWKQGSTVVGSTAKVTQSKPIGAYTYTLTVTDPGGLTSSDSVTITVTR